MGDGFGPEIVRMTGISKSFPGVQALDGVDLAVRAGEVHALVGENGAGKSTLIKILMGAYSSDAGEIRVDGQPVEIGSPIHAKALGLGAVYQDVTLARHLSVGENFFLGKLPTRGSFVDWARVHAETRTICERARRPGGPAAAGQGPDGGAAGDDHHRQGGARQRPPDRVRRADRPAGQRGDRRSCST